MDLLELHGGGASSRSCDGLARAPRRRCLVLSSRRPGSSSSAAAAWRGRGGGEAVEEGFTEDLLRVIFLLLASPADLIRACAACTSFRRIIADPDFIRRYRSIHPPLFLGFLSHDRFHPTGAPDHNAPAARALACAAAGFIFDYVPLNGRRPWIICDVRDGCVLLESETHYDLFPGLAVCDPLSRQYVHLPAIPDDLIASVQGYDLKSFKAVFVPSGDQEETAFKVVASPYYREQTFVAFIFCSGSGVGVLVHLPTVML
ncbi:hypothetical protein EJB05_51908, partial [Eragrostis curvula]